MGPRQARPPGRARRLLLEGVVWAPPPGGLGRRGVAGVPGVGYRPSNG